MMLTIKPLLLEMCNKAAALLAAASLLAACAGDVSNADGTSSPVAAASGANPLGAASPGVSPSQVPGGPVDQSGASTVTAGAASSSTAGPTAGTAAASTDACTSPPALFTTSVGPSIDGACKMCHVTGGVASGTKLVFNAGATPQQTYATLRAFAIADGSTLLNKTLGLPSHAGGKPLGEANAPAYQDLVTLVAGMKQACAASGAVSVSVTAAGQFWKGVGFASDATVMSKAAVLFAGRNATADELAAVAVGGEAALRKAVRATMNGPTFDRFIEDVGDTHFLTPGVTVFNNGGLNAADWPTAADMINNTNVTGADRNRFQAAVRREPLELLKFIVNGDRPYTELVSGNYTVVNGLMARVLNAQVSGSFSDASNDNEWRQATLPSQRLGGIREHAGVLSTHAWLNRFPTTATNRNRHRVNMLFQQFLATDVSALAVRPLNTDVLAFKVPTVENPACAACHDTIDPVAAGFQNWNDANRYLPNRTNSGKDHALPGSYRSGNYPKDAAGKAFYQDGDNWYRDGKAPGFGSVAMPGGVTGNPTALQWTGQQVASDSRFALGAVHFWFEGLFGRKPLEAPYDPASALYAAQLAAFNAQKDELDAIAARFREGYRVKDLLVDLITSKWFRAERATEQNAAQVQALSDVGSANLLLPAQLNQKLLALVGAGSSDFDNRYAGFALTYSDFDGVNRTFRAKSFTMMQTITIDRLVASRSCAFTKLDFDKPVASRLLFPAVTLANTPATAEGAAAITTNVRHLHKWLLKEDLAANDAEIVRTVKLFTDVWNDRATASDKPTTCSYNASNDPNGTGRAWAVVLGYLLGDPKFLYE